MTDWQHRERKMSPPPDPFGGLAMPTQDPFAGMGFEPPRDPLLEEAQAEYARRTNEIRLSGLNPVVADHIEKQMAASLAEYYKHRAEEEADPTDAEGNPLPWTWPRSEE